MVSIDKIMAYEEGEQTFDETVSMFQELINDGSIRCIQGRYVRMAVNLIDAGHRTPRRTNDNTLDSIVSTV